LIVGAILVVSTTPAGASTSRVVSPEFDAPSGLAVSGSHLWVTNNANSSVSEIDTTTGAWLGTYRSSAFGFSHPGAIAAVGADVFVANADNTITEIDGANGGLVRRIVGSTYRIANPVAITSIGDTVLVLNSGPSSSITEFSASTGKYLLNIRGAAYAFANAAAFATIGSNVFVADKGNNSVTEVNASTGRLLRVIASQGLSAPDGVAIGSGNVWVADEATSAVTEISIATGHVVANKTDAQGSYGFWHPTVMVSTGPNIYVATPLGTSPMVTKVSTTTAKPYWYMCNTNGPYYFSVLSAFAISGDDLWVASQTGANSKTPGARTGALTELSLGSGALVRTLPTH
jgi:hypothetical protein